MITTETNQVDYSTPQKNERPMIVTPTTTATDIYVSSAQNGESKVSNGKLNGIANGSSNGSGNGNGLAHLSPSKAYSDAVEPPSTSAIFGLLKFLLWNGPLMACWSLLLLSVLAKEVWYGPLEQFLQSFQLVSESNNLGLYRALDPELTYYHRRCDHRDISTHDANDLLIDPNMTVEERQEVVLTHGAAVLQDVLSHPTARELRSYLETRHHEFHSNNLKLPWDELFWDGDNGSRLSLGLGPEDASIVERAIAEVGANAELKKTVEAIVGEDPAVVEVSTLSTMHDAEPQGIHTDSDFFGSSVLYARSFLHSYTMFISLQDTTSRMGATTVCPGTHWCADQDLSDLCQCNFLDEDDDEEDPIGYCNTFEASSNGKTGIDVGVLKRGDAMMFNQNIWHRGPRNYDEKRKENRVMFIMTFISRRDFEKGDNRQQGWGTYYYMRHSMWGHLFSDLKTAASGGMDLFKKRIWKAYGLIGAAKPGNIPWLEHWARQMANEMDFFRDGELEDFQTMLRELTETNRLANWLVLDDAVLKYLFGDHFYDEDDEIDWKGYLTLLVESAHHQSKRLYFTAAVATLMANGVLYALYCVFWFLLRWTKRGEESSPSFFEPPRPIRDVSRSFRGLLTGHLLVLGTYAATRYYVLFKAPMFERIHKGDINFKAFPPLPIGVFHDPEYDEDGNEVGTKTIYEEIYSADALFLKQQREQRDFQMEHPKHPYSYYFEEARERLEEGRRLSDYVIPRTELPEVARLPVQTTAFPERNDVLIGSRFDADFLASMNFVLEFHPGTKDWIKLMKEHLPAVSQNADESYLDMVVDTIVSKIIDSNAGSTLSLLSLEGGTPRRFLQQDFETGWWTNMTKDKAMTVTRRALIAMARPESIGVSYKHWKQVLAESRFGKRRDTALAKKWMPRFAEQAMAELFQGKTASEEDKTVVSPMATKKTKGISTEGLGRILLPSVGRGLMPKSVVTGKSALSLSNNPLLRKMVIPFRVQLRNLMLDMATLKVGDHILYKGNEDQNLFYQATIVNVYADDDELEIQPLRFDDISDNFDRVTTFVRTGDIQFYRAVEEGDVVWALTEDPDEEDESWKTYEILFITPFGGVDMVMTDDFVQKFSEGEETFENNPIGKDVKDLMLKEDGQLPDIRLRQYFMKD